MHIVKNRKIYYVVSVLLMIASIAPLFIWGLNLGLDFKGGAILEVNYLDGRPDSERLVDVLKPLDLEASIRSTGDAGYILRMRAISEPERAEVVSALSFNDGKKIEVIRFDSIGPLLGKEAVQKSLLSIILVIVCIVLFITYAFRQVSEPVASWKYGIIAVIALIHDVIIPTGAFAILGHFKGYEVDTLFVTALLVVLGFSIHDTIVVFDRVRENLKNSRSSDKFEDIVGKSVSQTFTRSINTSLTTVIALVVLYFVGPHATQHFALALIIGIVAGTYSSVFLGSPLLVTAEKLQKKK